MKEELSVRTLLYTKEGIDGAVNIWKEFVKAKKDIRQRKGEEEEKDVDEERGMGELER